MATDCIERNKKQFVYENKINGMLKCNVLMINIFIPRLQALHIRFTFVHLNYNIFGDMADAWQL